MNIKGIPSAYNETCEALADEPFIEWIEDLTGQFRPGQICWTTVDYATEHRWYLDVAERAREEKDWKWKAVRYRGATPPTSGDGVSVTRHFGLEKNEHLVVAKTKERPVILIRESNDDWFHGDRSGKGFANWYVVPTFRYRKRHVQRYVEKDQCLNNPDNFYLPPLYSGRPGMVEESAARFHTIQAVPKSHLEPMKVFNTALKMKIPLGLTATGLKILTTHFYHGFGMFPELTSDDSLYDLFKEGVNELYRLSE